MSEAPTPTKITKLEELQAPSKTFIYANNWKQFKNAFENKDKDAKIKIKYNNTDDVFRFAFTANPILQLWTCVFPGPDLVEQCNAEKVKNTLNTLREKWTETDDQKNELKKLCNNEENNFTDDAKFNAILKSCTDTIEKHKDKFPQYHPKDENDLLYQDIIKQKDYLNFLTWFLVNFYKVITEQRKLFIEEKPKKPTAKKKDLTHDVCCDSPYMSQYICCLTNIVKTLIKDNKIVKAYKKYLNEKDDKTGVTKSLLEAQVKFIDTYFKWLVPYCRDVIKPFLEKQIVVWLNTDKYPSFYPQILMEQCEQVIQTSKNIVKKVNSPDVATATLPSKTSGETPPPSDDGTPTKPPSAKTDDSQHDDTDDEKEDDDNEKKSGDNDDNEKDDNEDEQKTDEKPDEKDDDTKKKKKQKKNKSQQNYIPSYYGAGSSLYHKSTTNNTPFNTNSETLEDQKNNIENFYKKKPIIKHQQNPNAKSSQTADKKAEQEQPEENNEINKQDANNAEERPTIKWWMWLLCVLIIGIFLIISVKSQQNKYDEEHKKINNSDKNTNLQDQEEEEKKKR